MDHEFSKDVERIKKQLDRLPTYDNWLWLIVAVAVLINVYLYVT